MIEVPTTTELVSVVHCLTATATSFLFHLSPTELVSVACCLTATANSFHYHLFPTELVSVVHCLTATALRIAKPCSCQTTSHRGKLGGEYFLCALCVSAVLHSLSD